MPCFYPFKVDNPLYKKLPNVAAKIPVPCGKCPYCLQRRANNWVIRCIQESKHAIQSHFVTLTYSDPPLTPNGFMTLEKSALQKFFKRIRKKEKLKKGEKSRVKYFACGEYGDRTDRPHYHVIIFNVDKEVIEASWKGTFADDNGVLTVNGLVDIKPVNENTVMYTAKYINKGKRVGISTWDDRLPEFQLFSKNLGTQYLNPEMKKYHNETGNNFVMVNGYRKALPRYYTNKIFECPIIRLSRLLESQILSDETYAAQYKEYEEQNKHRASPQTFEQWRYERKRHTTRTFLERSKRVAF